MATGAVFFSRCRPQYSDPIDLVVRERHIFIGYPAWRLGVEVRRDRLREAVVDLWCSDEEWAGLRPDFGKDAKQYQQNRNFVRSIDPGAIALVPRPGRGVVYAGRVIGRFKLLDDPPWGDDYIKLRRQQGLETEGECGESDFLADVAQCCEVDRFRAIPFPLVPAWIRRSLLGRSTYGRVWPMPELELDPYMAMDTLLDHPEQAERTWTSDIREVERRLVESVGPSTFEHLCVALLQLEHPDQVWMHVGESGDGGIDGVGADAGGSVVGLLQCKWAYWGESVFVEHQAGQVATRQILMALLHSSNIQVPEGIEFWPRDRIAALVVQYACCLPLAVSLRVKPASSPAN